MSIDLKVEGLEDAQQLLESIAPREANNIMRSTVHGMAGEIAKKGKEFAPEDQGELIANIKTRRRRVRHGLARSDVIVGQDAYYWRFLEYGTSKLGEIAYFAAAIEYFRARWTELFLRQFVKKFVSALKRARKRQGL